MFHRYYRRSPGCRCKRCLRLCTRRIYNEKHMQDTKSPISYIRSVFRRMNPYSSLYHRITIRPLYNLHCDIEISRTYLNNGIKIFIYLYILCIYLKIIFIISRTHPQLLVCAYPEPIHTMRNPRNNFIR